MTQETANITLVRDIAEAIEQEIALAIMFHETWKPSAYDKELHERMGNSYATQSFNIVRTALRREMLMALARLWEHGAKSISIPTIGRTLSSPEFFGEFCAYRASRLRANTISLTPEIDFSVHHDNAVKCTLEKSRAELDALIAKYERGGSHYEVIKRLMTLRNGSLAHRQKQPKKAAGADSTDDEIEEFYQDNLEIVRLIIHIVLARAFDLTEAAGVYRTYAGFFWSGTRGERTAGHPRFRPPPPRDE
ncbi:TPA: hypothetical protein QDA96_002035 [Burkholderia vietnamiensis]|uniref:AbiU2 domain-containing protein n=1 Tax=Burkholderia vietnamiensis TaxID=60552 RepID=UPI000758AA44|nr:hypothetical protein [Burkholderia vietnamiensis]KVS25676.1 hypothetical protein WK34_14735 [Burkholderia vietnamiensis]MBR8016508.1 hypothetical protein [Burkholderia vietnamiensis]HDR8919212.1 hypothetical protein [Burkholderia vietnamiensis]HDR8977324.1 hypothetical protein [Burkholderia vietnamiensis]HDR9041374.1 hypothetical protein [Burkholderia vietnamiensis]